MDDAHRLIESETGKQTYKLWKLLCITGDHIRINRERRGNLPQIVILPEGWNFQYDPTIATMQKTEEEIVDYYLAQIKRAILG